MRSNAQLLLLLCIITVTTYAQNDQPLLNFGDPAPPLRVGRWIKGRPIQRFEKGKVYVIEFWATWCGPCKAAMPHLSALARQYKDKVTVLGIDIYEEKTTSEEKVKAFVDSMGSRMDYHVAAGDNNFMVTGWFDASGERGIPRSFVVNAEGRLAWIGHPKDLDKVLPKIVNNTFDIKEALSKRKLDKYLNELDDSLNYKLNTYVGDAFTPGDLGRPDSALLLIAEVIRNEPRLKYASFIAFHTFSSLLKMDTHKAYEYGKEVLVNPTSEDPSFSIIEPIKWYLDKLDIPTEIYELGAEAYQIKIDQIVYPELVNVPKLYYQMAEWYWRAKNKSKAIDAQQKAIKALKSRNNYSKTYLTELESKLYQYKKM